MNDILLEFPTSQLHKGQKNLAGLIVTGALFLSGVLDFLAGERFVGSTSVSLFLLPFLPIFLLVKLSSKIRFDSDHVEKSTFLTKTRIPLKDIKSYGVCIQYGRFMPQVVNPSEVDEDSVLADNFVFISTLPTFKAASQNRSETITFQYRHSIYVRVKEILDGRNETII